MRQRKIVGWPYWITVAVLLLPLLYVCSFGPACWLTSRIGKGARLLPIVYRPMLELMPFDDSVPLWTGLHGGRCYTYPTGLVADYAEMGSDDVWHWRYSAIYSLTPSGMARTSDFRWEWADSSP